MGEKASSFAFCGRKCGLEEKYQLITLTEPCRGSELRRGWIMDAIARARTVRHSPRGSFEMDSDKSGRARMQADAGNACTQSVQQRDVSAQPLLRGSCWLHGVFFLQKLTSDGSRTAMESITSPVLPQVKTIGSTWPEHSSYSFGRVTWLCLKDTLTRLRFISIA